MTTKTISLNTIVDVKEFVNTVARYDFEVDLVSGDITSMANPSWAFSAWIFPNRLKWKFIPMIAMRF